MSLHVAVLRKSYRTGIYNMFCGTKMIAAVWTHRVRLIAAANQVERCWHERHLKQLWSWKTAGQPHHWAGYTFRYFPPEGMTDRRNKVIVRLRWECSCKSLNNLDVLRAIVTWLASIDLALKSASGTIYLLFCEFAKVAKRNIPYIPFAFSAF